MIDPKEFCEKYDKYKVIDPIAYSTFYGNAILLHRYLYKDTIRYYVCLPDKVINLKGWTRAMKNWTEADVRDHVWSVYKPDLSFDFGCQKDFFKTVAEKVRAKQPISTKYYFDNLKYFIKAIALKKYLDHIVKKVKNAIWNLAIEDIVYNGKIPIKESDTSKYYPCTNHIIYEYLEKFDDVLYGTGNFIVGQISYKSVVAKDINGSSSAHLCVLYNSEHNRAYYKVTINNKEPYALYCKNPYKDTLKELDKKCS